MRVANYKIINNDIYFTRRSLTLATTSLGVKWALTIYSTAPSSVPPSISSRWPKFVKSTTLVLASPPLSFSRRKTSNPSKTGITTSRRSTAGAPASVFSSASLPSVPVVTSNPASRNFNSYISRIYGSSSTISTLTLAPCSSGICVVLCYLHQLGDTYCTIKNFQDSIFAHGYHLLSCGLFKNFGLAGAVGNNLLEQWGHGQGFKNPDAAARPFRTARRGV